MKVCVCLGIMCKRTLCGDLTVTFFIPGEHVCLCDTESGVCGNKVPSISFSRLMNAFRVT